MIKYICEENLNATQYNECIKCIETLQICESKYEPLVQTTASCQPASLKDLNRKQQYNLLLKELDEWLKKYESLSDKHKFLSDYVNKIRMKDLDERFNEQKPLNLQRTAEHSQLHQQNIKQEKQIKLEFYNFHDDKQQQYEM